MRGIGPTWIHPVIVIALVDAVDPGGKSSSSSVLPVDEGVHNRRDVAVEVWIDVGCPQWLSSSSTAHPRAVPWLSPGCPLVVPDHFERVAPREGAGEEGEE